jgi:hypothetical protein
MSAKREAGLRKRKKQAAVASTEGNREASREQARDAEY